MKNDMRLFKMMILSPLLILFFAQANAEEYNVVIPFGAYNPELNTPAEEWFSPTKLSIKYGDTITWINDDREGHTITSGKGSGRFGWMSDDYGTPNGYFDSGRFLPGESWSFTFDRVGTIPYFCTIHPWMEGIVIVEQIIPDYPHDATGQRLEMPTLAYTPDGKIEVNLTWEPHVIKTHELIKFIYQFYDPATNSNLAKMRYDFVIFQNGKELYRGEGVNEIGGDYRNFVFDESGSIIIRFENIVSSSFLAEESVTVGGEVANKAARSVDFTAVAYDNPEKSIHEEFHISPAPRLEFYYEMAIAIIAIPAVLFILVVYWMRKKPEPKKTSV
jgi:plastocyanin